MNQETLFVAARMSTYFHELYEVSTNNLPPCPNAANGNWRNGMASSHFNKYGEYPKDITLGSDSLKLFQCFLKFHDLNHAAFKQHDNYEASSADRIKLNRDLILSGLKVFVDIVDIIGSDNDKNNENQQKQLAEDIKKLMDNLKGDMCTSGTHANGNIPTSVVGAAYETQLFIKRMLPDSTNENENKKDERIFLQVLHKVLDNIRSMPKHEYKPWLTADWQLTYSAIFLAASRAVQRIIDTKTSAK